ncbi:MAG: hypothetical protein M1839_003547 [Geoglossum umbratile]|nr:MAG: hypothetical protein M1839_003547 [Geoglossum umbratile]
MSPLKPTLDIAIRDPDTLETARLRLLLDVDSAENLMTYRAFREIPNAKLELSNSKLRTATGLVYPRGAVGVEFHIVRQAKTYGVIFWVVDTLAADALVGGPFIETNELQSFLKPKGFLRALVRWPNEDDELW